MSRRIMDEFGMVDIPRSHLAPTDPHDVPDGFPPTQVRGWLLAQNLEVGTTGTQQSQPKYVKN